MLQIPQFEIHRITVHFFNVLPVVAPMDKILMKNSIFSSLLDFDMPCLLTINRAESIW